MCKQPYKPLVVKLPHHVQGAFFTAEVFTDKCLECIVAGVISHEILLC
jgi:hypothetical protein